jgi:hypothetical protein
MLKNSDFEAKVLKLLIREGKDLEDLEPLMKETKAQQQAFLKDLSDGYTTKYQSNLEKYQLTEINRLANHNN